jgi:hypothetical protein
MPKHGVSVVLHGGVQIRWRLRRSGEGKRAHFVTPEFMLRFGENDTRKPDSKDAEGQDRGSPILKWVGVLIDGKDSPGELFQPTHGFQSAKGGFPILAHYIL